MAAPAVFPARRHVLALGAAAHEAWISVDEAGTEAAAATAGTAEAVSALGAPQRFVAYRPFLVVLYDLPTGAPLFVGTVIDPALRSS